MSLTKVCPTSVPINVGPPPITPISMRKPQLGRCCSPANGATMPKPSVALWSPKPMISATASEISPFAADWPIASPSEKLCRPMPMAMNSARRLGPLSRFDHHHGPG